MFIRPLWNTSKLGGYTQKHTKCHECKPAVNVEVLWCCPFSRASCELKLTELRVSRQNRADSDDRQLTLRHRESLSNSFIFEGIRRKEVFPLGSSRSSRWFCFDVDSKQIPSKFKSCRKFFTGVELFNLKLPGSNFLITSLENEGQKFRG